MVYRCFPTKENATKKNFFSFLAFFGLFLTKKKSKLTKIEENWLDQNCFMKFSKIWYVNAFQQKKIIQKNCFSFSVFFCLFLAKKKSKFDKKLRNWQNPNRLMKYSEIWYVDAFQRNKMLQKNFFFDFCLFWPFFWPKKQSKLTKNEEN